MIGNRQGDRTDTKTKERISGDEPVQKIGQVGHNKKTVDMAAKKAGFGNAETYRQAKKVIGYGMAGAGGAALFTAGAGGGGAGGLPGSRAVMRSQKVGVRTCSMYETWVR